jgi:predicted nicotinamide N-methyase
MLLICLSALALPGAASARSPHAGTAGINITPPTGCHLRRVAVPGIDEPLAVFERNSLADDSNAYIRGQRSDPFGQVLWPAAWAAATALAVQAQSRAGGLGGCCVVEAGAGLGLCSLTASRLGASRVIATDASAETLRLLEAAATAQSLQVECRLWDFVAEPWVAPDWAADAPERPDPLQMIFVAADVLYSEELADALALRCAQVCRRGGIALVADSVGLYTDRFTHAMRSHASDLVVASTRLLLPKFQAVAVAKADAARQYDAEVEVLRIGCGWIRQ